MNTFVDRISILLIILISPFQCFSQNVFSEKDFEYRKSFLPYDVPYIFALEDKHFVILSEVKKNKMKLGRYDQYFFDQWEKDLEFDEKESAPQTFVKGDSLVVYSLTSVVEKKQVYLSIRYFNLKNGEEYTNTKYIFSVTDMETRAPLISFSADKSKFVIYNYSVNHEGNDKMEIGIYRLGEKAPMKKMHVPPDLVSPGKSIAAHLSNSGDFFLLTVQASEFKVDAYYWGTNSHGPNRVTNNFFFERPVDGIGEISIVRQSSSSYFVSFTANIEEELIGFNVTGFNVILKTVMFSHNQNLRSEEINSLYKDYYLTGKNQKKKQLEIPEALENYRLVDSYKNTQNDIILLIEQLELPVDYYKNAPSENMPWKHKSKDDEFYFGGDILMYCFSEGGTIKWGKVIQKTQYSQANGLGLSFISRMVDDQLNLLMYESSKGGNFYILELNTLNGSLNHTLNVLPDRKFEFAKKYSCWLNDHAVILCGIAPANIFKRSLMLVEF